MISTKNGRLLGYARVSTNEQELSLQVDDLLEHGVPKELLFFDKLSGAREDRPGLKACNDVLRRGESTGRTSREDHGGETSDPAG